MVGNFFFKAVLSAVGGSDKAKVIIAENTGFIEKLIIDALLGLQGTKLPEGYEKVGVFMDVENMKGEDVLVVFLVAGKKVEGGLLISSIEQPTRFRKFIIDIINGVTVEQKALPEQKQ